MINTFMKWLILKRIAVSKYKKYKRIEDLWNEVKDGKTDSNQNMKVSISRPYFNKIIKYLYDENLIKITEFAKAKEVEMKSKGRIVKILRNYPFFTEAEDLINKYPLYVR